MKEIGINTSINSNDEYSLGKIYYLYFGLFSLGVGSIIYSLFCPENISTFPNCDDYTRSRIGLKSPTLCTSSFEKVCEIYARNGDYLDWRTRNWLDDISYSNKLGTLTHSLLMHIHGASPPIDFDEQEEVDASPKTETEKDTTDDYDFNYGDCSNGYMQPNGYINTGALAKDMVSAPRIIWIYTMPIKETAFQFQADVYYLEYMVDDLSSPIQRLACAITYAIGFILLLIPSLETFVRVLGHVLIR